jgi:hypothetical protein
MEGVVDIYAGEYKIKDGHNGSLGKIALHLDPKYAEYVSVEPHDKRIGIGAVVDEETGTLSKFMWPEPVNPKPPLPADLRPR